MDNPVFVELIFKELSLTQLFSLGFFVNKPIKGYLELKKHFLVFLKVETVSRHEPSVLNFLLLSAFKISGLWTFLFKKSLELFANGL